MTNRKLRDLTDKESKTLLIPGTIISYQDASNSPREAVIVARKPCKWQGEEIIIRWFNSSYEESYGVFGFQPGWQLVRVAG